MTDWSTLKKLIWLRIIKGGGSAVRTVKGAIVHVINALARPAISVKCEVNPIQDLHGYDSPWPAGGGKNIYPNSSISGSAEGVTITHNVDDESYKVSGLSEAYRGFLATSSFTLKAGTYTFSRTANSETVSAHNLRMEIRSTNGLTVYASTDNTPTFTLAGDTEVKARIVVGQSGVDFGTGITYRFQIEAGSSPSAWQPYSNICPISGRTSATVTRTGKNLLNSGFCLNRTLRGLTTVVNADGSIALTGTAEAATRYWNSANTLGLTLAAGTYTLSPSNLRLERSGGSVSGTFTLSEETTFSNVYWSGFTSGEVVNTVVYPQLELGSTATAYEPYAGNTYTIQLGDTVYGGTLDVTGGKMVVDRAKRALLGTENFSLSAQSGANPRRFLRALSSMSWDAAQDNHGGVSNMLTYKRVSTTTDAFGVFRIGTYLIIPDADSRFASASEFNSWLATQYANGTPLEICYPLATPFEITLTPTQIDMLLGENNLWADAGDSTLTYYAEGEASTSEALGILLGGTYNNPGGADDASDDEALGILLGGS